MVCIHTRVPTQCRLEVGIKRDLFGHRIHQISRLPPSTLRLGHFSRSGDVSDVGDRPYGKGRGGGRSPRGK